MKKEDTASILLTVIIGFLCGMYLYVVQFTQLIQRSTVETQEQQDEFSLVAQAYGGCRDTCPAFQVKHDGTYRYRFYTEVGQPPVLREGTLPFNEQRILKRALDAVALQEQSVVVTPQSCNSMTDGIDITYSVTYQAMAYEIDSCGTAVDAESELWLAFGSLWEYMRTVE